MTDIIEQGRQSFRSDGTRRRDRPVPKYKRNAKVPDRYQQLIDGVITIEDLDEEELFRGQLRGINGSFSSPPRAIPHMMHKAAMEAVGRRIERNIIGNLTEITESLMDMATGADVTALRDPKARVQAATYLLDRILGKTPERIESEVTITSRWEEAAQSGRLFVDVEAGVPPSTPALETGWSEEDPEIVDAEVVEEGADSPDSPTETTSAPAPVRPQRKSTGVRL